MAEELKENQQEEKTEALSGGAYEILRKRLLAQNDNLLDRINELNIKRRDVFGGMESTVIGNERIKTENNCVPIDVVSIGDHLLFAYKVFIGMKTETHISDVFSAHHFDGTEFHAPKKDILNLPEFERDFKELFKYYKYAQFQQFVKTSNRIMMIFNIAQKGFELRIFRFELSVRDELTYIDDRGIQEYQLPLQHDFEWIETGREDQVYGLHPHVSIEDKVFVETVGGDLTIKVENNTEDGGGVYEEPVENLDQTLDDASISYSIIDNLILIRVKPFRETAYRYFVYDHKGQVATRIDSIGEACVKLPEDHGIIFPKGYVLKDGSQRTFTEDVDGMVFLKLIRSPNGEDFFYIFYHREKGKHILLKYNLIEKEIATPILCNGFSIYDDGKMVLFSNSDDEPRRNHAMQIWQTPFYADDYEVPHESDSFLTKVGNRDLVRGIAEAYSISRLITSEDKNIYKFQDIVAACTDIIDGYYWLSNAEVGQIDQLVREIKTTAGDTVGEYEKVVRMKQNTAAQLKENQTVVEKILRECEPVHLVNINDFVDALDRIRRQRGHVISLRDMHYIDLKEVDQLDEQLATINDQVSMACVDFLLKGDSLVPYIKENKEIENKVEHVKKVADLKLLDEELENLAKKLDLLTDIVNNLNIDDPTKVTQIVDDITDVYGSINRTRSTIRNLYGSMGKAESQSEFSAQYKLLSQSITNYIGMCDSIEKCDEYLSKLMITVEELEGKFSDFPDFADQLAEKREEAYNAFTARKQVLEEEKQRKIGSMVSSAERIITGIMNRAEKFKEVDEVNAYFASDLMVSKLKDIIQALREQEDTVKADDFNGRLASAKDEILRRLRDKIDLYEGGDNVITFGDYKFSVNTQALELTTVMRDDDMFFHLTGTDFYEKVVDEDFLATKPLWDQQLISENDEVYRAEYLAYLMLQAAINNEAGLDLPFMNRNIKEFDVLLEKVQTFASNRYREGYDKGIHDHDACKILQSLVCLYGSTDLLRYDAESRAYSILFWCFCENDLLKQQWRDKLRSFGEIYRVFGKQDVRQKYIQDIYNEMGSCFVELGLEVRKSSRLQAAEYLYYELQDKEELEFTINGLAKELHKRMSLFLKSKHVLDKFEQAVELLEDHPKNQLQLIHDWVVSYTQTQEDESAKHFVWEVVALIAAEKVIHQDARNISTFEAVEDLLGQHSLIKDGKMEVHFDLFLEKLTRFTTEIVPAYEDYLHLRKEMTDTKRDEMRLSEFEPKVMGAFVRNKLINDVYLNLVGANFAKQMGTVGEGRRTNLMGLLMLISPPGYGKTTLMEYLSNRLGLTFMKINGPAIGHHVTSLDPQEAPNATSREELQKLNLSLMMGNNIMLYLDDIQHLNPEFLQKFISLCDAQRKIEGVYKGVTRTFDFRGKKVVVVMAGNPYTETGEKFQIPDMLSNRADTYNLGDISATADKEFGLSFIENSMTSNPTLSIISNHSHDDIYKFVDCIERESNEGVVFSHNYSAEQKDDIFKVLKKVMTIRDVILKVNRQYIDSAAQEDEYRTEPAFKLQGSYRNMNRMAEKIFPVMTDDEVQQLILDNYVNEAQILSDGSESNLLKLKEMLSIISDEELARWTEIKKEFNRRQTLGGGDDEDQVAHIISQLSQFNVGLSDIRDVLKDQPASKVQVPKEPLPIKVEIPEPKGDTTIDICPERIAMLEGFMKEFSKNMDDIHDVLERGLAKGLVLHVEDSSSKKKSSSSSGDDIMKDLGLE